MTKEFADIANETAERIRRKDKALEKEQRELEGRLSEIRKARELVKNVDAHLNTYNAKSGDCPACHVQHGTTSKFKPIPSDNDLDKFGCSECGLEVETNA